MLCTQFRVHSLAGFGCAALPAAVGAAGAVLAYLERTNPALLALLTGLRVESPGRWVGLDAATRRNLELTRSFGTGGTRSLLGVLDLTRTPMGARALRRLVGQPLCDLEEITRRHGIVGALVGAPSVRAVLGDALATIGDLERLLGRIAGRGAGSREFLTLAAALRVIPEIETILGSLSSTTSSRSPSGRPLAPVWPSTAPSIPARISSPCSRPRSWRTRPAPARSAPDSPLNSTTRWRQCGERGSGWPRWRDASGSGQASAR